MRLDDFGGPLLSQLTATLPHYLPYNNNVVEASKIGELRSNSWWLISNDVYFTCGDWKVKMGDLVLRKIKLRVIPERVQALVPELKRADDLNQDKSHYKGAF